MRIALTGAIASGKSAFSAFLNSQGVETLDADDVVHELEAPGGECVDGIVALFGVQVLSPDGGIDRRAVAKAVFGKDGSRARAALERIVLPKVRKRILDWCDEVSSLPRVAVLPTLFESGWEGDFDFIACIVSPEELQVKRLVELRGYSAEDAVARIAAQLPAKEKSARSNITIVNSSGLKELEEEAVRFARLVKEMTI